MYMFAIAIAIDLGLGPGNQCRMSHVHVQSRTRTCVKKKRRLELLHLASHFLQASARACDARRRRGLPGFNAANVARTRVLPEWCGTLWLWADGCVRDGDSATYVCIKMNSNTCTQMNGRR